MNVSLKPTEAPCLRRSSCSRRLVRGVGCSGHSRAVVALAGSQSLVPVTFQVEKTARSGEHVRVVGGHDSLGDWDAGLAPAMEPTAKGGSLWRATVEGFKVGVPFNFKFAVVPDAERSPADSRAAEWESIPNRTFQPGGAQTITAVWNKAGFEAGPAAPGTGGGGGWEAGAPRAHGLDAEVKGRLEATIRRLAGS